jgi:hypothetical protein
MPPVAVCAVAVPEARRESPPEKKKKERRPNRRAPPEAGCAIEKLLKCGRDLTEKM